MTAMTEPTTTQVYRVYIRTTPERVWDAITKPEWTERYGYQGVADYELRVGGRANQTPGAAMRAYGGVPDVIVDGEFVEVDPPRRLVQTWRMLMDPGLAEEGFTRLTHEIEPIAEGVTKLTVIHELERAPEAGAAGRRRARGRAGRRWRRLGVGAQRPQDAAGERDEHGVHRLSGDVEPFPGETRNLHRAVRGVVRAAPGGRTGSRGRGARLGRVLRLGPRRLHAART